MAAERMSSGATSAARSRRPAQAGNSPRPPRRTQPERTGATRRKLIEAAIGCLAEKGYAETSTTAVADRAGVSRGSLFYNYPTKADLMLAVIDHVYELDTRLYDDALRDIDDERDYALALTRLSWRAFSAPGGLAVMHIVLEGSSDPELKDRLPADPNELADELALLSRYMEFVTDVLWPEAAAEDHQAKAGQAADRQP
jgi:AcrR family transcriptional regulator